jgi:hypothetical protein
MGKLDHPTPLVIDFVRDWLATAEHCVQSLVPHQACAGTHHRCVSLLCDNRKKLMSLRGHRGFTTGETGAMHGIPGSALVRIFTSSDL